MSDYYRDSLAAENLLKCYQIAPPRVRQYFDAEIDHVLSRIGRTDLVLDLGCGYGRVIEKLAARARGVVGIDNSLASLTLARRRLGRLVNCGLAAMNAAALGLADATFHVVICIQNGMSAFHVDRPDLVRQALRVTKPGGTILFSTYAERFWPHRLEWFELQAQHGLIGEIDRRRTGQGVIVCRDGFEATTISAEEFRALASHLGVGVDIKEVDGSSLFCQTGVT